MVNKTDFLNKENLKKNPKCLILHSYMISNEEFVGLKRLLSVYRRVRWSRLPFISKMRVRLGPCLTGLSPPPPINFILLTVAKRYFCCVLNVLCFGVETNKI